MEGVRTTQRSRNHANAASSRREEGTQTENRVCVQLQTQPYTELVSMSGVGLRFRVFHFLLIVGRILQSSRGRHGVHNILDHLAEAHPIEGHYHTCLRDILGAYGHQRNTTEMSSSNT